MRYSPDELKAIVLHYGSYEKAAKKLKLGKASVVDAANADIKGRAYRLSDANYDKITTHLRRLSDTSRRNIKSWERLLDSISDHPNIKRAFMNGRQAEREWALQVRRKYGVARLKQKVFWEKVMSKFYDKYNWQRGRWSR